ncbi:hypothetical protein F183_A18470 [Bryobacterales bacterium F-183]|nr:hypothetical protein F183_A18470 [Bryobacterales bacterium F-183]
MKLASLLFATTAVLLPAATTATWEMNGYADFLRGKLQGLSLNRDGRLALAPRLDAVFSSEQPEIWSIARGNDGSLYLGTGHRGRVYRVEPGANKGTLLWTSDQPEVFAVAVDSKGIVYAGTSPDGKVYRIENGKATEYFAPTGTRYIWSLRIGPDNALYVGAGEAGNIYRVTAAGQGELYFESGQAHITALAFDRDGRLLAGSEPNGILYRVTAKGKAFVLFDSSLPEIRAILPLPDGSVYAAALGGSLAKRGGTPSAIQGIPNAPVVSTTGTSITVTDSQAGFPKAAEPKPSVTSTLTTSAVGAAAQTYEISGIDKSAIYKISADNMVENIWTSKDENIYDLALAEGNTLLFSTDGQGRVYRLNDDRRPTLILQTNEGETSRLVTAPEGIFAASGSAGKIYKLATALSPKGEFEAPVHDAGSVSRWGRLHWLGDLPAGTSVEFRTRTGNSSRPDATWSDWSAPLRDSKNALIASPNARFIQWKLSMTGSGTATPSIHSVTAAYLPQNNAPAVRSVSVSSAAKQASGSAGAATAANAQAAFSVTVTESGEAAGGANTQATALSRSGSQPTQVTWQADDPEGDKLIYALYFRGEDEQEWKLLRANLFENTYMLESDVLADGRYHFRVIASDRPSNPPQYSREAQGVSAPVLVDNTPPVLRLLNSRRNGDSIEIDVEGTDQTSMLRRCEYSIDANPWQPVESADGVTDATTERFEIRIPNVRAGEHLVVIRVYDQAGNAGLAKAVLRP